MAIGSGIGSVDVFRSGTGRDYGGNLDLNSPDRYRLGGSGKEHVGRPDARVGTVNPIFEEHEGWIRAGLAESDVFGALADADLNRLIGQGRTRTYAPGALVFRKGEPAHELMMVLCDLRITQSEIAGLVGATREKVNQQLCAWCRSGILALEEGHLMILDHNALHAISEED